MSLLHISVRIGNLLQSVAAVNDRLEFSLLNKFPEKFKIYFSFFGYPACYFFAAGETGVTVVA